MEQLKSIRGNIIEFSEDSRFESITDILQRRFHEDSDLETDFDKMHDPFLLKSMDKARDRLLLAKEKGERVAIFGDYDVDGVTSTSLLMHFFAKIGLQATYRLPHRVEDGYGLKTYFVDELKEKGVTLIVTVDCGTRDIEVVKHAKELGIDVIITDHHAVPDEIPEEAVAMINPKRKDCDYPFQDLCGAGVAFKLIQAVAPEFMSKDEVREYLLDSIDICAVGTVADCMQLIGENRIIVAEGLKQIKKSRSKGLKMILKDKIYEDLDADIFGFQIGPRLNAAGRLDSPYKAVNLLLNNNETVADTLEEIEELNLQRRALTKDYTEDAFSKIRGEDNVIIYDSETIEHGIIGIVAGRITEKYHKPSIVLKDEGDKLVGSCRSPEYFNIVELLEQTKDLLDRFGGHKQAAGFTVLKENYGEFKNRLKELTKDQDFSKNKKIITVDKVVSLEEIGFKFLEETNVYMPFGLGNKKPLLMIKDLIYEKVEFLGKTNEHLRINTRHGYKIFAFNFGSYYQTIREKKSVSLVFELSEDNWMGRRNLMLNVVDIA